MGVRASAVQIMALIDKGTPHRLIVKVIEVGVSFKFANQVDTNFRFVVCEGAELTVVAEP